MSFIQNFFSSRDNNANTETYVGRKDRLWYNPDTNTIRISDGITPGGLPIDLDIDANAALNSITANAGTINGNLTVTGNISPAAAGKIGGITPGPGVNVSNAGILTIDTANLPFSFGNFFANNNIMSIVNLNENMILQTQGNAEIQLVGNIGFYKPNVANAYLKATNDGQLRIYVPAEDPAMGAVEIIGSTSGNIQSSINTGTMLHVTGQNNLVSRIYNDSINNYSVWIGRRYNGTATSPTPVLAGESISRFGATTYHSGGTFTPLGVGRLNFYALENQTPTAQGSALELSLTAIGANTPTIVATWTAAAGMIGNVTGNIRGNTANFTGNVGVGNINATNGSFSNISVTGNISGNVSGTTLTANLIAGTLTTNSQPNITNVGTLTTLSVSGNTNAGNITCSGHILSNSPAAGLGYTIGSGGSVTQLTSKTTPVTLNKISGEITTSNSTLAGGASATFTLTNSSIANTDVMLINQVSLTNISDYQFFPVCNSGSASITIINRSNQNRSDAIVLRFVIIKGSIN